MGMGVLARGKQGSSHEFVAFDSRFAPGVVGIDAVVLFVDVFDAGLKCMLLNTDRRTVLDELTSSLVYW